MSKWTIDKQFDFCYGHRVWSQKLIGNYCESGDSSCKCRFLHGHKGHVHVFLESDTLERGMVTDFKHLGWLKNFLDDNLDHKFIIDRNDPLFNTLLGGNLDMVEKEADLPQKVVNVEAFCYVNGDGEDVALKLVPSYVPGTDEIVGYKLDVNKLTGTEREYYEGFFIVNFVPTSENLCKWLYEVAETKMSLIGVKVKEIAWNETPKSRAVYSGG